MTTPKLRSVWSVAFSLFLAAAALFWSSPFGMAQANIEEAVKSVVRVIPQRCTPAGCRAIGVGSGAMIHPSGIILTAWHVTVTDPDNLVTPIYADDFVIEMVEDVRAAPRPLYRAELIAVKPEMDLALLRIYRDESNGQIFAPGDLRDLPTLATSNVVSTSGQVRIMGYPPAGGESISYPLLNISGFDEGGALIKVQNTLSEGFSGGPALIEQEGVLKIVGVVIRRRGNLGEVGLIRHIDQLQRLSWFPDAPQVWGDNVRVVVQESVADPLLQISVDVNALDFVDKRGRLLAYVFDANTQSPWRPAQTELDQTSDGQLVLSKPFGGKSFVDIANPVTIVLPQQDLGVNAEQLLFKLVLWNADTAQALWREDGWWQAQSPDQVVAQAAILTSTSTSTDTPVPTATETSTPTETPSPTATVSTTDTPTSNPATPTRASSATPSDISRAEAVVNADQLNMRSGPGTDYGILSSYPNGTTLQILGKNLAEDWVRVNAPDGQTGWMSARFLRLNVVLSTIAVVAVPARPVPTAASAAVVSTNNNTISPSTTGNPSVGLLTPTNGANGGGSITFAWEANFALSAGQGFEIVFWKEGQNPLGQGFGLAAPTTVTSLSVNLDTLDASQEHPLDQGDYRWGVLLVQTASYDRIAYLGGGWLFRYQRTSGGSSGGDSSGPSPTDTPRPPDPIDTPKPTSTPPIATNTPEPTSTPHL